MRAVPQEEFMDQRNHRYLFAIMLQGDIQHTLEAMRTKYHIPAWHPKIGLHVTLLRPFWSSLSIAELARRTSFIVPNHRPFIIYLDGCGRFDNEQSVLYAHVVPSAALNELQQDLRQNLEYLTGPADLPFTPHVSLSAGSTTAEIDMYLANMAHEQIGMSMVCNNFSLLRMDTEWHVVSNFNLR